MHFTDEQRLAWQDNTRDSPFNIWLREQCCRSDGTLDLASLHALAARYGVDAKKYAHLNPGQQRMNIGNRLRRLVPADVYESGARARWPGVDTARAEPVDNSKSGSEFSEKGVVDLLRLHGRIISELRRREVIRTGNAPLGDYAEHLFSRAFDWQLAKNSGAGFDATDDEGRRFQIKARRIIDTGSRQLGVIRRLNESTFDFLAAALFDRDYNVARAAIIPHSVVVARAVHTGHVNGWRLLLEDSVWEIPGVSDVTGLVSDAQRSIG